jgi:hypothetical protein
MSIAEKYDRVAERVREDVTTQNGLLLYEPEDKFFQCSRADGKSNTHDLTCGWVLELYITTNTTSAHR